MLSESEKKYLDLVQWVRVLDVVFIGPVMIYGGMKQSDRTLKIILIVLGICTIIANGYNFYLHEKSKADGNN